MTLAIIGYKVVGGFNIIEHVDDKKKGRKNNTRQGEAEIIEWIDLLLRLRIINLYLSNDF